MLKRFLAVGWLPVVLVLGAGQCLPSQASQRCQTALDCGPFHTCEKATGRCLCSDNRACGDGEFCNSTHRCQTVAGCSDNTDCELLSSSQPLICDVKTALCQASDQCFQDSQCPLNQRCDLTSNSCSTACQDEADCVLGYGCVKDDPNAAYGHCTPGTCTQDTQCKPGEYCDLTTSHCVFDARGPFCGACQSFNPLDPQCGDPANYCLIDTGDPARRSHYCGVDCSQQQGCPNGYTCKDVIIVGPPATPACNLETCTNGVCTVTGAPCSMPVDCPQGPPGGDCARAHNGVCAGTLEQACSSDADCGGASGACRFATCRLRESAAYGFCSCVVDSDCPADECRDADLTDPANPVAGHCLLSGHRCFAAEDCNVIACVQGGCLIGRNCKPGQDRRCVDLQMGGTSQ